MKHPPRTTRLEATVSSAQLRHGIEYEIAYRSSVHSHTFPARSDCAHFPSPVGDFEPTFCVLLHGRSSSESPVAFAND